MKEFHQPAAADYEDNDIAIADISPHLLCHYTDQRVDTLVHACAVRAQMMAHSVIEAEHIPCFYRVHL